MRALRLWCPWSQESQSLPYRMRKFIKRFGKVCKIAWWGDRKSTRLNSNHGYISYAVFCLKKKTCDQDKEHGYTHALWTAGLLARHARGYAPAARAGCVFTLVAGTVCKLLAADDVNTEALR